MKKILIIDDKPSERQRGKEAAEKLGLEPILCDPRVYSKEDCCMEWMLYVPKVDYVATDLMWRHSEHAYGGEKPNGLLVVIHAKHFGKPVGICTNGGDFDKGHHGEAIGFIHDGYISPCEQAPGTCDASAFEWNEGKNWEYLIQNILDPKVGF